MPDYEDYPEPLRTMAKNNSPLLHRSYIAMTSTAPGDAFGSLGRSGTPFIDLPKAKQNEEIALMDSILKHVRGE